MHEVECSPSVASRACFIAEVTVWSIEVANSSMVAAVHWPHDTTVSGGQGLARSFTPQQQVVQQQHSVQDCNQSFPPALRRGLGFDFVDHSPVSSSGFVIDGQVPRTWQVPQVPFASASGAWGWGQEGQ